MRTKDIGRRAASCETCQRVSKAQKCAEPKSVIQFKPTDKVGMDFTGQINPPCEATGAAYIVQGRG
jgi:hypothetical protein